MHQRIHTEIENNQNYNTTNDYSQLLTIYMDLIQLRVSRQIVIYSCIKRQSDQEYYAIKVPTQIPMNIEMTQSLNLNNTQPIKQLNKIKLGNLIHPEDIFYEQNCVFMTQQMCLNNFLLKKCIQNLSNIEKIFILLQLSITLQELQRRQFPIYNLSLDTLYIINNMLHLSFLHFNFQANNLNQFELFNQFVLTHFPIGKQLMGDNFQQTTNILLEYFELNESEYGCDFFQYIKRILQIENEEQYPYQSNSYIFVCPRPEIFRNFQNVRSEIFIKTPKFIAIEEDQINYQQLQNHRELEFNEDLADQPEFATLVAYFRVQNQSYFFYPKYSMTLDQFFIEASTNDFLRLQYKFAFQFAQALKKLHNQNILHRDIKPSNVYLNNSNFARADIKIADFDRSRRFYATQDLVEPLNLVEQDGSIFSSTFDYDPPEALSNNFNFSSDIWQFGLTLFQMANHGKYPIKKSALIFQPEDYDKLNEDYIREKLEDKGVNSDYIQLLIQCLNRDLNKRITLQQFIKKLTDIRIQLQEIDTVFENNDNNMSQESTGQFDNSINWNIFQTRIVKTPDWKLNHLQQPTGDTFNFIID